MSTTASDSSIPALCLFHSNSDHVREGEPREGRQKPDMHYFAGVLGTRGRSRWRVARLDEFRLLWREEMGWSATLHRDAPAWMRVGLYVCSVC
jgi:hypothetical protein